MTESTRILVSAGTPYDVVVGRGLLAELPAMLGTDPVRVAVIHPAALRTSAEAVREDLLAAGYTAILIETAAMDQRATRLLRPSRSDPRGPASEVFGRLA